MCTITELQATNVKRLRAVTIRPDGSLVQITGKNAQGKTSVLDSIALGLAGKKWLDAKPIRDGADRGEIIVTLDNGLVIKRTITQGGGGGTLTVTDAAGTKLASPQAVLDKMAASLGFDPLAFSRMKPAEQVDQLKRVVGLDFSLINAQREQVFENRRDLNREVESLRVRLASMPSYDDAPEKEVSVAELARQSSDGLRLNAAIDTAARNARMAQDLLAAMDKAIAELEKKLLDLKCEREQQAASTTIAIAQAEAASKTRVDLDAINAQLGGAEETNRQVRANAAREKLNAEFDIKNGQGSKLTAELAKLDKSKHDQLAAAKFPIDGLSFDDAGVIYQAVPFAQASAAEKLRVSVAMALAMSPDLKVLLIRDGSLLDPENLATVAAMAEQAGAQVWIERVDSSGRIGVVIEDGAVAE